MSDRVFAVGDIHGCDRLFEGCDGLNNRAIGLRSVRSGNCDRVVRLRSLCVRMLRSAPAIGTAIGTAINRAIG